MLLKTIDALQNGDGEDNPVKVKSNKINYIVEHAILKRLQNIETADRLSGCEVLLTHNTRSIDRTFYAILAPAQRAYTRVQEGYFKLENLLEDSRIQRGRVSLFRMKGVPSSTSGNHA